MKGYCKQLKSTKKEIKRMLERIRRTEKYKCKIKRGEHKKNIKKTYEIYPLRIKII